MGTETRAGTETIALAETGTGTGTGTGNGDGKGNENEDGRGGGDEVWYPPHQEKSRIEDQVLPFRTRDHLCRWELAPIGSQQPRAQDPAPAGRYGTEGRRGHQGREGEYGDGNRDGGRHGDEDTYYED